MKNIILDLERNKAAFKAILSNIPAEIHLWKPTSKQWCLLEVICHLYDEEREDFRPRIKRILETPYLPLDPFDPTVWVTERKYIDQNFEEVLNNFLVERTRSIDWLQSLKDPQWDNFNAHPTFGNRSARMFLANWLAHDYIHLRQINRLKYGFLAQDSKEDLSYAGNW